MRIILVAVLLLIAVVAVYETTIGGENGSRDRLLSRTIQIEHDVEGIDP
jgi:hypothetical protein